MKMFIIIDDYTSCAIWDEVILTEMLKLPTKPKGWNRPENKLPEGEWTLANGMYPLASDGAYQKAGIPKPDFEQLPVIFCVDGDTTVRQNKVSAEQAVEFIRARAKA